MAQQDQGHLWSTGLQVQSPARHSGLRIRHCSSCGVGHNCGSDPIPGLETPYATEQPKKEEKKKKRKKKKMAKIILNKDLLYGTGKSTRYSVITFKRKESEKEWLYV